MHLVPPETRAQFEHTIEWLHEWPCTRKIGMGTPAPWAEGWIIESLSDSTIYMAYYTVAHLLKRVDPEQLSDEVFDFIFHGKGDPENIAQRTGIPADLLRKMRAEFEYWYPLDYRMSANELIPNHLTFHIFHHAQLFPDRCPRGIVSFGMAILEGQKMSSSKGNIIAINEAVRKYGADTVRMYLLSVSEPWQDMDWKTREVEAMQRNLERFYQLAEELMNIRGRSTSQGLPERWLLSRLQYHAELVTEALENFETRKAVQHAFFMLMQDVRRYLACAGDRPNGEVLRELLESWVRLLAPFTPHLCEELWKKLGKDGFVSEASWPAPDPALRDRMAELAWDYVEEVIEDISGIKKVLKSEPERACVYVAEDLKWRLFQLAVSHFTAGRVDFKKLMEEAEQITPSMSRGDLSKLLQRILASLRRMSPPALELLREQRLDEYGVLQEMRDYIARRTGLEIQIFRADDQAKPDPAGKARLSLPLRPSLYLE
jgi:leucyl-tRNA synthetase